MMHPDCPLSSHTVLRFLTAYVHVLFPRQVELADEKGDARVIDILSRYASKGAPLAPEGSFGYTKWQVRA